MDNQNNTNNYDPNYNPNNINQSNYNPNNYNPNSNQNNNNQNYYNQNYYNPNTYNPYSYGTGQSQNNSPFYPRRPFDPNSEPMTLKDWILTFLLLMIPFANIILPFVWAFGSDVNRSKKTYFQAYLIMRLIGLAISIIMIILLFSFFSTFYYNIINQLNGYSY